VWLLHGLRGGGCGGAGQPFAKSGQVGTQ
jgi:hypothetical protein